MEKIDKKYVERRVQDWEKRIKDLYKFVETSLSNNPEVKFSTNNVVSMHEELMRENTVPKTDLPTLDLIIEKQIIATFIPVGLWVIGANGRIDILSDKGAYILVDTAEAFNAPIWTVYTSNKRKVATSFDSLFILTLVS